MEIVNNKYSIPIMQNDFNNYLIILKNNIFKVLCLREEKGEWQKALQTILYEISGLYENFNKPSIYIKILNKLESLNNESMDDKFFRKTIFEILNSLDGEKANELS